MNKISESICTVGRLIIPLADVQHIEKEFIQSGEKKGDVSGCSVIMKSTRWNYEHDTWDNSIWLVKENMEKFLEAWTYYRYEIEGLGD